MSWQTDPSRLDNTPAKQEKQLSEHLYVPKHGGRNGECATCGRGPGSAEHSPQEVRTIRPNYYKVKTRLRNEGDAEHLVECHDVIEALALNYYLGDALKYLWRLGRKEGASKREDIKKTITYLNAELDRMNRDGEP